MGSIYVICSRQCPNGDGIYTLLYALYKYSTSITNQPTNQWEGVIVGCYTGATKSVFYCLHDIFFSFVRGTSKYREALSEGKMAWPGRSDACKGGTYT